MVFFLFTKLLAREHNLKENCIRKLFKNEILFLYFEIVFESLNV